MSWTTLGEDDRFQNNPSRYFRPPAVWFLGFIDAEILADRWQGWWEVKPWRVEVGLHIERRDLWGSCDPTPHTLLYHVELTLELETKIQRLNLTLHSRSPSNIFNIHLWSLQRTKWQWGRQKDLLIRPRLYIMVYSKILTTLHLRVEQMTAKETKAELKGERIL